jgi:Fe-S cluster biogenesis protein NfuA
MTEKPIVDPELAQQLFEIVENGGDVELHTMAGIEGECRCRLIGRIKGESYGCWTIAQTISEAIEKTLAHYREATKETK